MVVPAGFTPEDPVDVEGVRVYSWTPPADAPGEVRLSASEGPAAALFAQEGDETFEVWFAARERFVIGTWGGDSYAGMTSVSAITSSQ